MELLVHVDLCEALVVDVLQQLQGPWFLQDQSCLEGLLLAAESLLDYLVQIESLTHVMCPSAIMSVNIVVNSTREVAQLLEHLDCQLRQQSAPGKGRPKLQVTEGQLVELL